LAVLRLFLAARPRSGRLSHVGPVAVRLLGALGTVPNFLAAI